MIYSRYFSFTENCDCQLKCDGWISYKRERERGRDIVQERERLRKRERERERDKYFSIATKQANEGTNKERKNN